MTKPQQPRAAEPTEFFGEPSRGSSIRPLSRLLGERVAVWVFSGDGRISFVSAGCARWVKASPDELVGRRGLPDAQGNYRDPYDALVFSLRPALPPAEPFENPAGVTRFAFTRRVSPATVGGQPVAESRPTIFIPIPDDNATAYLAIANTDVEREFDLATGRFRELIDGVQQQLAIEPRLLFSPLTLGGSVWAERLKRHVEMATRTDAHITIHSPPGGGGEALARLIDFQSYSLQQSTTQREASGKQGLIKVAGSLMDAELFDATTGGLVNQLLDDPQSSASLLVLDIDQMPHEAQERLALLLNNHAERLRVFVTTLMPANELAVKLLHDLAIQFGLFEIYVPPLSERIEDLPAIATAMLHRRHATGETAARQIGREALDRMILYPWPGNYEELDASIRSAVRHCHGETIHLEHLPLAIRSFGNVDASSIAHEHRSPKIIPLDQAVSDAEKRYIVAALEQVGGNKAAAARLLEISRGRLLRRIEQLGIDDDGP